MIIIPNPTDISGLDELFHNEWKIPSWDNANNEKEGIVVLVKGKPGTGKTTFVLQFLLRLLNLQNDDLFTKTLKIPENILYYSLEQSALEIENRLKNLWEAKLKVFFKTFNSITKSGTVRIDFNKVDFIKQIFSSNERHSIIEYLKENEARFKTDSKDCENELKAKLLKLNIKTIKDDISKHEWKKKYIDSSFKHKHKIVHLESRKTQNKDFTINDSIIISLNKKVNSILDSHSNQSDYKVIIIDGLSATNLDERKSFDIENVINRLKRLSLITILVLEPTQYDYSPVENFADITLEFAFTKHEKPFEYHTNQLIISKARHQHHVKGYHQYSIPQKTGLVTVYPSVYHYMSRYSLSKGSSGTFGYGPFEMLDFPGDSENSSSKFYCNKNEDTKNEIGDFSLLTKILGRIRKGSNTIILGSRRTSKSLLTLDFILSGLMKDKLSKPGNRLTENGLIVSLLDNYSAISKFKNCRRLDCPKYFEIKSYHPLTIFHQCQECFNKMKLFHLNAEVVSSNIFFFYLRRALDEFCIAGNQLKRLTFWDFTSLNVTFPLLSEDKLFVSTFFKFLKYYKSPISINKKNQKAKVNPDLNEDAITSIFFSAPKSTLASASLTADNVIYVWRDIPKDDENETEIFNHLNLYSLELFKGNTNSFFHEELSTKKVNLINLNNNKKLILAHELIKSNLEGIEEVVPEYIEINDSHSIRKIKEFLIIYIDRVEFTTQIRPKEYYAFPIHYFDSPLNDFGYIDINKFKFEDPKFFKYAVSNIKAIEKIQGI